jgi:hypothetical protein
MSDSHEGLIVSDGIRQYRIVNGFRVHLEEPSPELLREILEDAIVNGCRVHREEPSPELLREILEETAVEAASKQLQTINATKRLHQ